MPHLTGLAALAATESSANKTTTAATLTDGLFLWRDPVAAIKDLKNLGTYLSDAPEKGLGMLIVPLGVVLIAVTVLNRGK